MSDRRRNLSPKHSIRSRLAIVGTLLLFACFAIGGVAFDRLLTQQLSDNLDLRLSEQATDRATAITAGLDPTTQLATIQQETAVAVFDDNGMLLATRGFGDANQLADLAPGSTQTLELLLIEDGNEIESTQLRVATRVVGRITVVVASEAHEVDEPVSEVRRLLVIGIPLISLAGGVLLWFIVGRSLQPVERMRRDAQSIADVGAGERVHQPANSDELGRLAETMNDMLDRLDANAATLRQFVSDSSHEIRSPITSIRARVETADPADWTAVQSDIVGEVERVEAIISDLTFLAKSDEGRVEHRPERIEIDDVLFAEASRLQQRGTMVDASEVEPIVLVGDRGQIRRVVRNLVDNAERHASAQVRMAVHQGSDSDGLTVVIDIDDDGGGIAPDDRERIFDRFARLDEARERGAGGTGLGLAIVRDIVERHGGAIHVLDAPIGGTRVRVALPAASIPPPPQ